VLLSVLVAAATGRFTRPHLTADLFELAYAELTAFSRSGPGRRSAAMMPDAGELHVRFDEQGVETELRRGYSGTARRKGRQQTNRTYDHRATSRLYRRLVPSHAVLRRLAVVLSARGASEGRHGSPGFLT